MNTLKELIEGARTTGISEDVKLANEVSAFLTNADATIGVGTKLSELISAGRLKEYAVLKRFALANGGSIEGKPMSKVLEEAEQGHWHGFFLKEMDRIIMKNPEIISGNQRYGAKEHIDADKMVVALQRMQDDTSCLPDCSPFIHAEHGTSRLEQALGKEGADKLLREMYAAQKLGVGADRVQKRAIIMLLAAGVIGVGLILLNAPIIGTLFGICGIAGLLLLAKRKSWL